jgi:lipopolysaccharide export system protein LptC
MSSRRTTVIVITAAAIVAVFAWLVLVKRENQKPKSTVKHRDSLDELEDLETQLHLARLQHRLGSYDDEGRR